MRLALITVLLGAPVSAQSITDILLRPRLDTYLELTTDQKQRMSANVQSLNQWSIEKYHRALQLQTEIAQETAKPSLDALALGTRYVELEGICRQSREKTEETRRNQLQILSAAQKAKLTALEDVLKVVPLLTEAQARNLIGGPTVYSQGPSLMIPSGTGSTGGIGLGNRIPAGSIGFLAPVLASCPGWAVNPLFPSGIIPVGRVPDLQN